MNNEAKKVTVKKNESFLKGVGSKDGKMKYDLKITKDQTISFSELKDKSQSTDGIEVEFSEAGKNEWKKATDVKVAYSKGHWRRGLYIPSKLTADSDTIELKGENEMLTSRLSTNVHTFGWATYVTAAVSLFAVLIIGYYLFSSGEEKEEESL